MVSLSPVKKEVKMEVDSDQKADIHQRATCFQLIQKFTKEVHRDALKYTVKELDICISKYFLIASIFLHSHIPECIHIRFWGKEVITSYSFKPEYSCENILMF